MEHGGFTTHPDDPGQPGAGALALLVDVSFSMAIVSSIVLAWVYAIGGQPQAEGFFLALALAGIGIGLV